MLNALLTRLGLRPEMPSPTGPSPPVPAGRDDPAALAAFLRRRAAFVAQKTVLDYVRVKARLDEARLLGDPDFAAALRHCRWSVFLGSAADHAALAEAWLRPHLPPPTSRGAEDALGAALARMAADAIAAEGPPEEEREAARAAADGVAGHLAGLRLGPPRPAHRLPLLAEAPLLATIPVAPEQRVGESEAIRGALRFHTVSSQQEMERAFDPAPLAARLASGD